jgi:hypothetical protein
MVVAHWRAATTAWEAQLSHMVTAEIVFTPEHVLIQHVFLECCCHARHEMITQEPDF